MVGPLLHQCTTLLRKSVLRYARTTLLPTVWARIVSAISCGADVCAASQTRKLVRKPCGRAEIPCRFMCRDRVMSLMTPSGSSGKQEGRCRPNVDAACSTMDIASGQRYAEFARRAGAPLPRRLAGTVQTRASSSIWSRRICRQLAPTATPVRISSLRANWVGEASDRDAQGPLAASGPWHCGNVLNLVTRLSKQEARLGRRLEVGIQAHGGSVLQDDSKALQRFRRRHRLVAPQCARASLRLRPG